MSSLSNSVCVCVCVRERERELVSACMGEIEESATMCRNE